MRWGLMVLHGSIRNGRVDIAQALLNKSQKLLSEVDKSGRTALHTAVIERSVPIGRLYDDVRRTKLYNPVYSLVGFDDVRKRNKIIVHTLIGWLVGQ